MNRQSYPLAWTGFQDAVAQLYAQPVSEMVNRGAGVISPSPNLVSRAQAVVSGSAALGQAAASGLASQDAGQRELAELKLLAAASSDYAIANDLISMSGSRAAGALVERGPGLPGVMADLHAILDAPLDAGIEGFLRSNLSVVRASGPTNPAAARQALVEAVEGVLTDIPDIVGEVAKPTLTGITQVFLPTDAAASAIAAAIPGLSAAGGVGSLLEQAAEKAIEDILDKLEEEETSIVGCAIRLAAHALDKLLQLVGVGEQASVRKQAAAWIRDLKEHGLIGALLERLYEIERIRTDVTACIKGAGSAANAALFNSTTEEVSQLAARFNLKKQPMLWTLNGLGYARSWLMALPPWGPIGITTSYLLILGYIVYSGGDYVDWYRTGSSGSLDFVPGVRDLVNATFQC